MITGVKNGTTTATQTGTTATVDLAFATGRFSDLKHVALARLNPTRGEASEGFPLPSAS